MKVEFYREGGGLGLKVTAESAADRIALAVFTDPVGVATTLIDGKITLAVHRRLANMKDEDHLGPSAVAFHVTPPPPPAPVVPTPAPK